MKIFIVFLAICMLFGLIFFYNSDLNNYIRVQTDLKNLAEDCAEAVVLCINADTLEYDAGEIEDYVIRILNSNKQFPEGSVSVTNYEITRGGRGVRLELTYNSGELFKLPFFSVDKVVRIAEYAWE